MTRIIDFRDLDGARNNNNPTGRSPNREPQPPHAAGPPPPPPGRRSGGGKWIVVIAIAVGLIFYFGLKDNPSREQQITRDQQTAPKSPEVPLPLEALKILERNKSVTCSYYNGLNSLNIYISDTQNGRRIKQTVTNNLGGLIEHLNVKSEMAYRWNVSSDRGYKFSVDEEVAKELFINLQKVQKPGAIGSFKCEAWKKVDESYFELPSNINFIGVTGSPAPQPSDGRGSSPSVEPHSELVAGKNDVRQILTYAMTKGGVDHEADIAAAKRRVESLTRQRQSDPGLRKQAREANERGLGYSRADKWAEAVQAFQAAYKADSTDVEIINNLGYASLRHGDLQAAEALLLRALIFAPGRSSAWANLGETYAQQGNLQAAVACFANAYRFTRNQDATRQFLQKLTQDSVENVREAARQSLQLQLIEKTSKQVQTG